MAGHVEDRWYRDKLDENGKVVLNSKGKPVRERSALYGKGLRYRVRYYVGKKERSKSFPDKQLKRAEAFLSTVQVDLLAGKYVDPKAGQLSLRDYVAKWRKGQSSDASYQQMITTRLNGMVWPFFGDMSLAEAASVDTIRDWLEWMVNRKRKGSYRAQLFDMLSAILGAAVDEKRIEVNPCKVKSIKRPKPEERRVTVWPDVKLRKVHMALPEHYKVVVPLGAGAGLRQMEVFGFSPDDINRTDMELNVVRQIRWIGPVAVFAPPKGGKSRTVPLGDGVLARIDDYLTTHQPLELTLPWLEPGGDPVTVTLLINRLTDGLGRNLNRETSKVWRGGQFLLEVWKPAFAASGVPYTDRRDGMHALRHLYASNLLANGASIKEVSAYLGHHDPAYTLKIYTHLVQSSHSRARAASDRLFPSVDGGTASSSVTA